jgi:hypothetical protein
MNTTRTLDPLVRRSILIEDTSSEAFTQLCDEFVGDIGVAIARRLLLPTAAAYVGGGTFGPANEVPSHGVVLATLTYHINTTSIYTTNMMA